MEMLNSFVKYILLTRHYLMASSLFNSVPELPQGVLIKAF